MTETAATCKRELELEIPAENVQKATEKVARDLARVARIPGFRPGKAPVTLIRRRFADDIKAKCCNRWCRNIWKRRWTKRSWSPSRARKWIRLISTKASR